MIFTPEMDDGYTVFVFGSNENGRHLAGAAREAALNWGAREGVGFGCAGKSFAIPTLDWVMRPLSLAEIQSYVNRFLAFANHATTTRFLVTAIGTGICGYSAEEIKPMFADAPNNCVLPDGWR